MALTADQTAALITINAAKVCVAAFGHDSASHICFWRHPITGRLVAECAPEDDGEEVTIWEDDGTETKLTMRMDDDIRKFVNPMLAERGWTVLDRRGNILSL